MKHKTALILLLIANVILAAHAVIPHHHHTNELYSFALECTQESNHEHINKSLFCDDEHKDDDTHTCFALEETLLSINKKILEKKDFILKTLSEKSIIVNQSIYFFDREVYNLIKLSSLHSLNLRGPPTS